MYSATHDCFLIAWKHENAISKAEKFKMSRPENLLTEIVYRDSLIVGLMQTTVNIFIKLEKR